MVLLGLVVMLLLLLLMMVLRRLLFRWWRRILLQITELVLRNLKVFFLVIIISDFAVGTSFVGAAMPG